VQNEKTTIREVDVIARIIATSVALFLAFYAFWGDVLGGGHFLNPSGIAFLLLTAFIWFGWGTIRGAFKSVADESNIPIIRLGSAIIRGMRYQAPAQRKSGGDA
jgi:hypothetical protein